MPLGGISFNMVVQNAIKDAFQEKLGRLPTNMEMTGWTNVVGSKDGDTTWLHNAINASQEYQRRLQYSQTQPPQTGA